MTKPRNPHLLTTAKCAAPGCTNVRREANHWFSSYLLSSALLAGRTRPPQICAPWMNPHAARHALKSFLKDISPSRSYDNPDQPGTNCFSRTREEQNAIRP